MRFIHTADIHLGASPDAGYPWGADREREIWETFRNIIAKAEAEKTDLLLIAGDLFHRQPLLRELKEVNSLFEGLSHTKVVLIAGNHDYLRPDSHYQDFSWCPQVTFLDGERSSSVCYPELRTEVYGVSYHTQEITTPLYDQILPKNREPIQILLAHGGDNRHSPLSRERILGNGFDYVALGHIHRPGILAENRMAYSGAPEPLDINDTGPHGYIRGEIQQGRCRIQFVEAAARRYWQEEIGVSPRTTHQMLLSLIRERIEEKGIQNLYRFRLKGRRDADLIFDTEELRRVGHILNVEDETEPDYDLERLEQEHREDLIGRYIRFFRAQPDTEVNRQAFYYGIEALLHTAR